MARRWTFVAASMFAYCLCFPLDARADAAGLDALYDRIAADVREGRPMHVVVYVALCDNDSQGIVPVKNRRICDGNVPEQNIYWATSGGLAGFARHDGYRRVAHTTATHGDVLVRSRWRKTLRPGRALQQRGVRGAFEVELEGIAYRGSSIGRAMHDFVRAVHHDLATESGPAPHVVGYIGHDYLLDVASPPGLFALRSGDSAQAKGVFALACLGDRYIRPLITRDNARILALNRQLAYPGAWTVGGMIEGLARGEDARGVLRSGARRFAQGMRKPEGAIVRSLAYGP